MGSSQNFIKFEELNANYALLEKSFQSVTGENQKLRDIIDQQGTDAMVQKASYATLEAKNRDLDQQNFDIVALSIQPEGGKGAVSAHMKATAGDLALAKGQINKLETEATILNRMLNQQAYDFRRERQGKSTLAKEKLNLEGTIFKANKESKKLELEKTAMEHRYDAAKKDYGDLLVQNALTQADLDNEKVSLRHLQLDLLTAARDTLRDGMNEMTDARDELVADKVALEAQVAAGLIEIDSMTAERDTLNFINDNLAADLNEMTDERDDLKVAGRIRQSGTLWNLSMETWQMI